MKYLCNDQLTRIQNPKVGVNWKTPKTYRVGDGLDKHGMRVHIRAFGVQPASGPAELPRAVYAVVKYPRVRGWVPLFIGDTHSFSEKLVPGRHRNPIFNR